jgi:phosphoenolpyruvate carboxykinase (GTP)
MPRHEDIDWSGHEYPKEKFDSLQAFDRREWRAELISQEELFLDLHARLPKEMIYERELLICRM